MGQTASIFSNTSLGLGLASHNLSTRSMGMGNAGLAVSDSMNINLLNYSKWADLRYTLIQAGFLAERSSYSITDNKGDLQNSGLSAFMLAIPLKEKRLTLFANLFPMNHLNFEGYSIVRDSSLFDREFFSFRKGDVTQLNFGLAARIKPNVFQAIHFQYIVGSYNDEYRIFFDNSTLTDLVYKYEYTLSVIGIGYSGHISFDKLDFGYYVNNYLDGTFKRIVRKPYDVSKKETESYSTTLPYETGMGLAYSLGRSWLAALDFNFKNYAAGVPTFLDNDAMFENYSFIHAGLEKKSKAHPFMPIIKRMDWRFGAFYGNEGYKVNNESLQSFGITFGAGIPLNAAGSKVDIAIQIGKRGNLENNKKEETFIKLGVGFKTFEKWFHRFNK